MALTHYDRNNRSFIRWENGKMYMRNCCKGRTEDWPFKLEYFAIDTRKPNVYYMRHYVNCSDKTEKIKIILIQDKAKTFQIGEHTILRDISRKTNEINENSKILYKYKTYVAENGSRPNLVLWNKYTGKKFPIPKDEIEYNP